MKKKRLLFLKFHAFYLLLGLMCMGVFSASAQKARDVSKEKLLEELKSLQKPASVQNDAKGQTIYYQGFDGNMVPDGWTEMEIGIGWDYDYDAEHWWDSYHYCDDWMISPAITLPQIPATLDFYQLGRYMAWADAHGVFVSEAADMSDSTLLYDGLPQISNTWEEINLDLSAFAGKTIYIGFNYKGYDADLWVVDDVEIKLIDVQNYLTSFSFDYLGVNATINPDKTIEAVVPYHIGLDTLTAFFENSPFSTVKVSGTTQVSGVTKNNFTSPVKYSVSSYTGLTRDYTVTVSKAEPLIYCSLGNAIASDIYNDTIEIVVPANAVLASQVIYFGMADPAYSLKAGTTQLENGVSTIDVTSAKVITAVAGSYTKNYTLIVTKEGALNNLRFIGYVDKGMRNFFNASIYGTIDETAKTIAIELPYGVPKDSLLVRFSVKDYVNSLAYNGVTIVYNDTVDFSTNANLVLTLNDPAKATETYAVTVVNNSGSYDNELVSMYIDNLTSPLEWDSYGRRISGVLMYDSTENIAPIVVVSPLASVTGPEEFSFSGADTTVVYTITSQNGLATSEWSLTLVNGAPSTDADILAYNFPGKAATYMVDTNIYNVANAGTDITEIKPVLAVSLGATVDFGAVSPTTADFTDQPLKYTIKAQDKETTKDYAVYMTPIEGDAPVVTLKEGEISNVDGSFEVTVKDASSILGLDIALVHKDFMAEFTQLVGAKNAWDDATNAGEFVVVSVGKGTVDTVFSVSALGLKPGVFYAVAGDMFGNISDFSADSAVVIKDTMEVDSLIEMDNFNIVYKYTGKAIVTYKQNNRNQKFIQDVSRGILIDDQNGILSGEIAIGDEITGFTGKLYDYFGLLEFQPVSGSVATVVSSGNEVEPVVVTLDELNENFEAYQSQLVKVNFVTFPDADNSNYFTKGVKYPIITANNYDGGTFRTSFYDADYIGQIIPSGVYSVVGIKTVSYGESVLTARSTADFTEASGYAFEVSDENWDISMTGIYSDSKYFTLTNEAIEPYTVKRIYIEGDPQFTVNTIENVTVPAFGQYSFYVDFAAEDYTTYNATLFIELTTGEVKEIPLHAEVSEVVAQSIPYFTDFEEFEDGYWPANWEPTGSWGAFHNALYTHSGAYVAYINYNSGVLYTPEFDLTNATFPLIDFWQMQYFPGNADMAVKVSTDGGNSWDLVFDIPQTNQGEYTNFKISLADYAGNKVKVGLFYQNHMMGSNCYWFVDDFAMYEQAISPVFAVNYPSINFGVVDGAASATLKISNKGISYFTLDSVKLQEATSAFALQNVPATAVDVANQSVSFKVIFDGSLGQNADTIIIYYTDPRDGAQLAKVPVSAFGVSCSAPIAAVEGTNVAPFAPAWFEFTPANDALITISSCGDWVDTDLKVYDACGGKVVAANDDDANCGVYEYSSSLVFAAHGGVTYKINWIDTWESAGFEWTLNVAPLPTGPTLLSVETQAVSAEKAKAVLSFENMIELLPASKNIGDVHPEVAIAKLDKVDFIEGIAEKVKSAKDFVPDGDDESEPNGDEATAKVITVGTANAPAKITGKYGVTGDVDWFAIPANQIGYYFDITAEVEAGVCDVLLVYLNEAEQSYYGWRITGGVKPGSIGSLHFTQLDKGVDTMYIWVRRYSAYMSAVAEPGYGYNLKVWSSAPPVFSIYRDNYRIAGPESMAFSYIDEGININTEYCYTVTQETYDGSESGMSNAICVTPKVTAGVICEKAIPVEIGLNQAPSTPYWYSFTSDETVALKISSNIAQNGDPKEDWNDTWLFVYANCGDETPLYEVDDIENGVIRTSEVEFVAEKGVTYLIQWKRWAAEGEVNAYDGEPFYFTVETAPVQPGEYVENAIPVTLPLVDFAGSTVGYKHNYDKVCGDEYFMQGNDIVYTFDIPYGGTISGGIEGEWVGIHIFKGKVGSETAVVFEGDETGGSFSNKPINPGTYYILVSTQLPTEATDFVINLAFTPYAKQSVTFNVNMNVQAALGNFDLATDSVDVVGTFNRWEHTMNMTDEDGDGIYTYTIEPETFYVGEQIRYKYRINGDWATAELSGSPDVYRVWTVKNGTNSSNDLFDNMELPKYNVTFKLAMARQVETKAFNPATGKVGLDLTGESVEFSLKDSDGDMTYEYTVKGIKYGAIDFAFTMDGVAETIDRRSATIHNDTTIVAWFNNDNAIDVPEMDSKLISVYPNPSDGKFTLDLGQNVTTDLNVEVLNVQGQVVKAIDMKSASQDVDMKSFAKGVYYIRMTNGDKVSIKKLVIQ